MSLLKSFLIKTYIYIYINLIKVDLLLKHGWLMFVVIVFVPVLSRRIAPIQTPNGALQSADPTTHRRLSAGWHHPREEDDRSHQSAIQQLKLQVRHQQQQTTNNNRLLRNRNYLLTSMVVVFDNLPVFAFIFYILVKSSYWF